MIHSLLKLLPPERAHAIAKWAMRNRIAAPGQRILWMPGSHNAVHGQSLYELFGHELDNPLGLAAGFDKNGELVGSIRAYGFGFLEVGSVTLRGGPGNPKPRLFRLPGGGLLNRMGLNGDPAPLVAERLAKSVECNYGVNIAKTHDPDIVGDKAIDDVVGSYRILRGHGIYTVLNISCPNTREGKTFEDPGALRELLEAVSPFRRYSENTHPAKLLLKLSPTLAHSPTTLMEIIELANRYKIDGFVASNTFPVTDDVFGDHLTTFQKYGRGGLSGPRVRALSLLLVKLLRAGGWTKTIIGCGGISTASDIVDYKLAGADLFQAYYGFVSGPLAGRRFAHDILESYQEKR